MKKNNNQRDINLQNRIAIAVRTLRVSAGLSQQELAKRTKLTQAAISQTERKSTKDRKGRMNLTTLKKITDALDEPLWELIKAAETMDVSNAVEKLERARSQLG